MRRFSFRTKVWIYMNGKAPAAWHFVNLPKKLSKEIRETYGGLARGWGSLPVDATIGETTWKTSIFPDNKTKSYLLPLKAKVREREEVRVGKFVHVQIAIRM